jgi:hypothetical protein
LSEKKYLSYTAFAGQTMENIFSKQLDHAKKYTVETLSSVKLVNNKKGGFSISLLPSQIQLSPVFTFLTTDFQSGWFNRYSFSW